MDIIVEIHLYESNNVVSRLLVGYYTVRTTVATNNTTANVRPPPPDFLKFVDDDLMMPHVASC
jgi:hypothetical protein